MRWIIPILSIIACGSITQTYAACPIHTDPLVYPMTWDITNYHPTGSGNEIKGGEAMFSNCSPAVYTRAVFNASAGELTAISPFGVNFKLNESGLSAETITWLQQNLQLTFDFKDAATGAKVIDIISSKQDYAILPGSPIEGGSKIIDGLEYYLGSQNIGIRTFGLKLHKLSTHLKFITAPSTNVINDLNKKSIRIKLGDLHIQTVEHGSHKNYQYKQRPMYVDIKLNFKIPTCTMKNVSVDLGETTLDKLKSQKVSNSRDFNVEFRCEAIASKSIYATISDAFNPSNINNDGVLLNHPTLENTAKNIGVQLLTDENQPLKIGNRATFTPTDETSAPTYYKKLKAQFYRTDINPTSGYVNAQATVLLDYE